MNRLAGSVAFLIALGCAGMGLRTEKVEFSDEDMNSLVDGVTYWRNTDDQAAEEGCGEDSSLDACFTIMLRNVGLVFPSGAFVRIDTNRNMVTIRNTPAGIEIFKDVTR
jgi:hypothetical protein